jgi:DMSO reductase family type II enzyme chaperone
MRTQSESRSPGQWTARTDTPKRSVFANYQTASPDVLSESEPTVGREVNESSPQAGVDLAMARAFTYRFLAKAFEGPASESWSWLCDGETLKNLGVAARTLGLAEPALSFEPPGFDAFHSACLAAFGHAARGSCPLNEIEYGDIKADPLFQPHRLADLAAFYRAFGLEVAEDAGERHDHLCLELEFMCVLAAREAYALEHRLGLEALTCSREAQRKFLREHLGRWTPAFARRLAQTTQERALQELAEFTRILTESECARLGVKPGSDDLLLRPVDESAESMCASCGIANLPPGAVTGA